METNQYGLASYGKRPDGSNKSSGFFGELPMKDGSGKVMTELSTSINYGNGDVLVPFVNPYLNKEEISYLQHGYKPTKEMVQKTMKFGFDRLQQGLSPFITPNEQAIGLDRYLHKTILNKD